MCSLQDSNKHYKAGCFVWICLLSCVVSYFVLCMCFHVLRVYQPHTLPRLSVLAAPFMYRREERYWIPGSFSVLACGSLTLCPGILTSRLAFGMLSCWLRLGLLSGLAFGWWCLRCGKIGLSSWLGLTASSFGEPQRISSLS